MPVSSDSSVAGYLAPTGPIPLSDLELDTLIGTFIAGVTGLPSNLVRPRWQDRKTEDGGTHPRTPNPTTTWCAVGVTVTNSDDTASQVHISDGDGSTVLRRFDTLEVLASFYGPKSDAYAKLTRDSFYIAQNRDEMDRNGLGFLSCDPIRRLPEIIAMGTRRRSDLAFRLVHRIDRTYAILNVLQGVGDIIPDTRAEDGSLVASTHFQAPET